METVYPLLKPHDWPHRQRVAHFVLGDVVTEDGDGVPIVTFGFDTGDNYQFVPASACDDIDSLFVEALANLSELNYPWEIGNAHGLRFAASSGNEFSAERVLDPDSMLECHELLEADRIIVAAPRRTCLFAAPDDLSDDKMALFIQIVLHTYHDDSFGHAPISNALFYLEDGRLCGFGFA